MFLNFAELKEDPFRIAPDPRYLYLSKGHAGAQSYMESARFQLDGFVVITGEIGSGKSILIHDFLSKLAPNTTAVEIHQTNVSPVDFLQSFLDQLGFKAFKKRKAELLSMVNAFLQENSSNGNHTVLIVDEAQKLSLSVLEEIRMLSGIERGRQRILSIILAGQPEFWEKLQSPKMKQFAQRAPLHFRLQSLGRIQTEDYVRHRLKIAGDATNKIFDSESFNLIYRYTNGVPRLINILCSISMLCAYADGQTTVKVSTVEAALNELRWTNQDENQEEQLRDAQDADVYKHRIEALKTVAREKLAKFARKTDAQEKAIVRLRSEINDKSKNVSALQDEINRLQENKSTDSDRDAARSSLENEVAVLSQTIVGLKTEFGNAKKEHLHLGQQFDVVNANNLQLAEMLKSKQTLIEKYEKDIDALRRARLLADSKRPNDSNNTTRAEFSDQSRNLRMLVGIDDNASTKYPIRAGRLSLGSSSDNDVYINSDFTSPHHARIISNATMCVLEDLGSTNGTYVNAKRIRKHALRNGDAVTIGKHRFRYVKTKDDPSNYQAAERQTQSKYGNPERQASYKPISQDHAGKFEVSSNGSENRIVDG